MDRVAKNLLALTAFFVALLHAGSVSAQASFPNGPNPHAVATFQSIGLYWYNPGGGTGTAMVEFKEQGSTEWRRGLDLWYDSRNLEYRGSLVELRPGTTYDIRLTRQGASGATLTATTWSENFQVPAGHDVTVPAGTRRIVINPSSGSTPTTSTSGTTFTVNAPTGSGGFTRVSANPGQNVIIGSTTNDACIDVNHGARNLLITGLVLRDCRRVGVLFNRGSATTTFTDNIIIDGNEIFGWGGFNTSGGYPLNDGAIHCNFDGATVPKPKRIIMQRNVFRDPRHPGTHWDQIPGHPHSEGAQAVTFSQCGGNHVFRYNDVHANGNGHHYNDGFGGCCNFSNEGSPGADSDIYGNRISHVYDDGIEAEGGNRNVRIWGNYLDRVMTAIGNAATAIGPLYVWRNVSNDMALMKDPSAPNEGVASRGTFVKAASNNSSFNGGRAYYFHNTLLQPPAQTSQPYPRGAGHGLDHSGGSAPLYNFVTRNNIYHIHRVPPVDGETDFVSITANCNVQGPCSADYDLFNGRVLNAGSNPEVNGWGNVANGDESSVPTYASLTRPSADNGWSGNFALAPSSLGYQGGVYLPNFNDLQNPDPGAHQSGTAPMKFGVAAASTAAPPNAHMTAVPTSGTAPLTVIFDASGSTPGSAAITSYVINFGDGTPNGTGAQQNHTYASSGTYVATLTVTDANNASDTYTETIRVNPTTPPPPPSTPFEIGLAANPGVAVNRAASEGIVFTAQALDGRALQSVRFYYDGVLKLTDTTTPYEYSWTSTAADTIGNHILTVEVTDTAGTVMTETRSITILPAACGIFVSAASLVQGQPLQVQSVCSAWENPERVDLVLNDIIIRRDAARPYTWTVDTGTLALGPHTARVRGVLAPGRESNDSANIEVLAGPLTIAISPGPAVVRGEAVTITASAADGRALRQVDFFVDGHFRAGQNVAPFQYTWRGNDGYGRLDAFGRHTLVVLATDLNGNVLTATRELYALTQACNALADTSRYQVGSHDTVATGAIAVTQGQLLTVHGLCSAARTVQSVEFFIDGVRLGSDVIPPYGWPVSTAALAAGNHTFAIRGNMADGTQSNHAISFEVVAP